MHQHAHDHDKNHDHGPGAHDHHHDHHHHQHVHDHAAPPWISGRSLVGLLLLGLALLAGLRSLVMVDQTEAVYITEFGRPVRLIREPGLAWKWPHQSARRFDVRLQVDTPPAREMLTRDKKNLQVAWYTAWRIAEVDRFLKAVRTLPDASARLEDLAASILAAALGGQDLTALVQVGDDTALVRLMDTVSAAVRDQATREYGVEVVDVRLRGLNYPEEVRTAVFEQIRSERRRVAAATRAEGESQARQVRSAADREKARVVAEAEAEAARTIGEGEAAATRIANQAHAADPAFYQFLKTLETYRAALDGKTTLVLSADSPFLRLLTGGPAALGPAAAPVGGDSPGLAGDGAPAPLPLPLPAPLTPANAGERRP